MRFLGLLLLIAPIASAQAQGSRIYFGQDVFVAPGQQIHNAVCVFCSVQVEGDLTGRALVLFGNLNVTGRVERGATVVWGNAVVDSQARIGGNAVVLGGNAVYETDDSISGSAYVLGGHLSKTGVHAISHRRVSVGPAVFIGVAILVILLLSVIFFPRVRHRPTVNQTT
ncbi:hypothetical protein EDE15_3350 [Edaphobacter aggregans]|uniref:Cytoskeletal protein CcmA (Bactofilin family) n=2 Tax=Edaphobacter aggregans TaxID=570835 RepID=A0A3R9PB70_9BACT|nr:hypothetical protein EDE15_3350 [Edaphobacter aggregans]